MACEVMGACGSGDRRFGRRRRSRAGHEVEHRESMASCSEGDAGEVPKVAPKSEVPRTSAWAEPPTRPSEEPEGADLDQAKLLQAGHVQRPDATGRRACPVCPDPAPVGPPLFAPRAAHPPFASNSASLINDLRVMLDPTILFVRRLPVLVLVLILFLRLAEFLVPFAPPKLLECINTLDLVRRLLAIPFLLDPSILIVPPLGSRPPSSSRLLPPRNTSSLLPSLSRTPSPEIATWRMCIWFW